MTADALREEVARIIAPDWFSEIDGAHPLNNYPGQHKRCQERARQKADAAIAAVLKRAETAIRQCPSLDQDGRIVDKQVAIVRLRALSLPVSR